MILYDLYIIRHNCIAPFLIKISHRSLAITFGYSLSNRGAVSRPFQSTSRVVWPTRNRGASARCGSSSFSVPSARGSYMYKPQSAGRGSPCRNKYGAAAHNRCCAQASAPARAAARDRGADGGLHQRRRGLEPSGPGPARERRLGRMPSTLPTPTGSPGTGNGWTTTKGRSARRW